jgi:hypothetical protein
MRPLPMDWVTMWNGWNISYPDMPKRTVPPFGRFDRVFGKTSASVLFHSRSVAPPRVSLGLFDSTTVTFVSSVPSRAAL